MKPKPFVPIALNNHPQYVKDRTSDIVWHRCQTRTLYADTDRSQVVYHANYLRYFEFGRASLMRDAAYPYKAVEESGYVYPIIKVDIDYFDSLSGSYTTVLAAAALASVSTQLLMVGPGIVASANVSAQAVLPDKVRITATHADTDAITYSVGAVLK